MAFAKVDTIAGNRIWSAIILAWAVRVNVHVALVILHKMMVTIFFHLFNVCRVVGGFVFIDFRSLGHLCRSRATVSRRPFVECFFSLYLKEQFSTLSVKFSFYFLLGSMDVLEQEHRIWNLSTSLILAIFSNSFLSFPPSFPLFRLFQRVSI